MSRYLIEVSQESGVRAQKRIKNAIRMMGSHFAVRANWSREDGVCRGTLIVEADDKWRALGIVPPNMRRFAQAYRLEPVAA